MKNISYKLIACFVLGAIFISCGKKENKGPVYSAYCDCKASYYSYVDSNVSVFVPNAFTPNGDGKNDLFRLENLSRDTSYFVPGSYLLSVVYGNDSVVFQTSNLLAGWDGRYVDNTAADSGTYYYNLRFELKNGLKVDTCGCITLVKPTAEGCIFFKPTYIFPDQFNPATGQPQYDSAEDFCR